MKIRLRTRLALFNFLSKIIFSVLFIALLPLIVNRISLIQTDNELVVKREQVIDLIARVGIEPFIDDSLVTFGSYNILKEEFISLEKAEIKDDLNFIELDAREIDNETIDYRVLNYSLIINDKTYLLQIGKSLTSITSTQRNIKKVILIFLAFIVLITLISDLFYTESILHPLGIIVSKLKNTSSPALFDKQPVKTSTVDFQMLDETIVELMNRITTLISKEKEITANISHELLTPVSVIRGKLENILLNDKLSPELSEKVEVSLNTLHRLKTLINSLLFFSRIESHQYLKGETFSIGDLINNIFDELVPISTDKGVNLTTNCKNDFTVRDANRSLMFSMLYNVVNNAIKNTDPGGNVVIETHNENSSAGVSITDNGTGIPAELMNELFSRFRKKSDRKENGNGIGLAITKSIADFHKIDISVETKSGIGTRFFFRFPENS